MSQRTNPNLSSAQFVSNTKEYGGATMQAHTGRVVQPGEPGFFVGGQPDAHNKRIETQKVPSGDLTPEVVEKSRARISAAAPDPNTLVGSWHDNNKGPAAPIEIDASGQFDNHRDAMNVATSRGERAVWNNRLMREIRTRPRWMGGDRKNYSSPRPEGFGAPR